MARRVLIHSPKRQPPVPNVAAMTKDLCFQLSLILLNMRFDSHVGQAGILWVNTMLASVGHAQAENAVLSEGAPVDADPGLNFMPVREGGQCRGQERFVRRAWRMFLPTVTHAHSLLDLVHGIFQVYNKTKQNKNNHESKPN